MRQPERVLLLRPGALGDVLLALPAVTALNAHWPQARFTWLGYPRHLEWLAARGRQDQVRSIDSALFRHLFDGQPDPELAAFLRDFEYAVAWVRDPQGHVARTLQSALNDRFLVAAPCPQRGSGVHAADHLQGTLSGIPGFHPRADSTRSNPLAAWRAVPGPGVGIVHAGSGGALKCWPLEYFQTVALRLRQETGCRIHWLLGPADERLLAPVKDFCGKRGMECHAGMALAEVAGMLRSSAWYLGNDSGLTHLAAGVGAPTFAVFGPTAPEEWAPRGPRVHVFRQPVECSPCSDARMRECPDRRCLVEVSPGRVAGAILAQIYSLEAVLR